MKSAATRFQGMMSDALLCVRGDRALTALLAYCTAATCVVGEDDESCRSSGYLYQRSSVVCSGSLIDCLEAGYSNRSICAKGGLGRACDASPAHYPLIWGHRLGIKLDLRQAQTWRSLSARLWSRANSRFVTF